MANKTAPAGMVYEGRYSGYATISSARMVATRMVATRMERKLWATYNAWKDANSGPSNKRMIDNWVVYRIDLAPMAV